MLVVAPYLMMDGMNEKGFIISVLKLDGDGTAQLDSEKHDIMTTVAMRFVLDKAATVEEALNMLNAYNMHSAMPSANFHFYLADANGHYCILEYESGNGDFSAKGYFDDTLTFAAMEDPDHEFGYVTNFYKLFDGCDDGQHGLDRYEILASELKSAKYKLSEDEAMTLLSNVYQDFGETSTHETQWSVVYNPNDLTAKFCMRENQEDTRGIFYGTQYDFDLKAELTDSGSVSYTVSSPKIAEEPETNVWIYVAAAAAVAVVIIWYIRTKKRKNTAK